MAETAELTALFATDDWNADTISQIKRSAFVDTNSCERFRSLLSELERGANPPQQRVKLGLGHLLLGRTSEAVDTLQKAPESGVRDFYLACALRELGRYRDAAAAFERAARNGWDELSAQAERGVALVSAGEIDQAKAIADQLAARGQSRGAWHYLRGRVLDAQGQVEQAMTAYEKAVELEPQNGSYLFRLAAVCDLYGDDDRAVELYRACAALPVVSVNTLLNLAVINEDIGEHEDARDCVLRVLASNPNHPRARLYLRDVEASMHMYIDEEQERERAERTAILDTPISEFELSVRSRNCLKKMNIFTLGDLLRISEAELLAYKNFGETSLSEIKVMLAQKGLQLGQLATAAARPLADPHPPAPVGNPDLLNRPVAELELSVRSRKCLQRLMISSIGELVSRTEPELLATRNFGQTSLSEIKRRLTEMGLSLRRIG